MKQNVYQPERMKTTVSLGDWLGSARAILHNHADLPGLEAQVLASHVTGKPRAWIASHLEYTLTDLQQATLDGLLLRLLARTPLPYLTGTQEFYGLDFRVSPDVLIPRPETELLVDAALQAARHLHSPRIIDVGTGSGCIAVSLAKHASHGVVFAIDRSIKALQIAKINAQYHQVDSQVSFVQGDLLSSISCKLDIICANLPYIPTKTLLDLPVIHHEPRLALDGGEDGLILLRRTLEDSLRLITSNGLILMEIEQRQGKAIWQFARSIYPGADITIQKDFAGNDRLLKIHLRP